MGASKYLALLRQCGGFSRFVHIARCTLLYLVSEVLMMKFASVFSSECLSIDTHNVEWQQAQLSWSRGGLGLRSLPQCLSAAYATTFAMSGFASHSNHHLLHSVGHFNSCVFTPDVISIDELLDSQMNQKESEGAFQLLSVSTSIQIQQNSKQL